MSKKNILSGKNRHNTPDPQADVGLNTAHAEPMLSQQKYIRQIVHDINNYLMVMQIYCDTLAENLPANADTQHVTAMQQNIKMIAATLHELSSPKPVDKPNSMMSISAFWDYLQTQKKFISLICGEQAKIEFLHKGPSVVDGPQGDSKLDLSDDSQLKIVFQEKLFHRVLMQILRNSVEAFLVFAQHNRTLEKSPNGAKSDILTVQFWLEVRESRLLLHIKDNGPGFKMGGEKKVLLEGISTKSGENRGYGLPAALRLVELWGGELHIFPQKDEQFPGAHLYLSFPILATL